MTPTIDLQQLLTGAIMTVTAHPFSYAKTLIQLGHEPLAPQLKKDLFFRQRLLYPGVFEYLSHIKATDGFVGLYRGLLPRMCAHATMTITYECVKQTIKTEEEQQNQAPENDFGQLCVKLSKESAARSAAVILSHPFHVIAIRSMASFVGGEDLWSSFFGASKNTWNEDGLMGFFAGLVPRLLMEAATMWLSELAAYMINTYIITEKGELRDLRNYTPVLTHYMVQGWCYPLSVVTTVMATNGTSLQAGRPPFIDHYNTWSSCLIDLRRQGMHQRGASMLFRKAILPRDVVFEVKEPKVFEQIESPFVSNVADIVELDE